MPLALVSGLSALSAAPLQAQTSNDTTLQPVVVSASRFASDPAFAPIGATVIDADQIREAGIDNVNEAIRKIGGVYGRQNIFGTSDYSLDLRGFGTTSDQNVVVMVDGIRLSENELTPALLSSIPVESVERIEIVRGGSSVLYGEGATGGTINIITRRAAANTVRGTVSVEAGSHDTRAMRAYLAKGWDAFSLDANVSTLRRDNYRDNNKVSQDNFSGGLQWGDRDGRVGLRVDAERQSSGLPGSLTMAQYLVNPRQTLSPSDSGDIDLDRYTLFAERRLGDFEFAAELSHRERTSDGTFFYPAGVYASSAKSHTTQLSPRVRHLASFDGGKNELVVGVDLARWTRQTDSTFGGMPSSQADAIQKSYGLYVRDEVRIGNARVAGGVRREKFDKDSIDPVPFTTNTYSRSDTLNAWELQGSYAFTPLWNVFAKAAQSYRVANADENGATPLPDQPLAPQTSHDMELGTTLGNDARKLSVKLFRHRLRNEIFYDATRFANVNLDPTERKGIEIEASVRVASAFLVSANWQHVQATFTEGPNSGNEVALVPRNTAMLRLNWMPGNGQSAYAGLQWVDSQRYGGDFSNTCSARVPSFVTMDARYAKKFGAWEFAVTGSNLTDKRYFSNAFGECESGIYPDPGRQLRVSARLDF